MTCVKSACIKELNWIELNCVNEITTWIVSFQGLWDGHNIRQAVGAVVQQVPPEGMPVHIVSVVSTAVSFLFSICFCLVFLKSKTTANVHQTSCCSILCRSELRKRHDEKAFGNGKFREKLKRHNWTFVANLEFFLHKKVIHIENECRSNTFMKFSQSQFVEIIN